MKKQVTVAILDADGELVRWRGGGLADDVVSVQYESALPGGFGAAQVELQAPAARLLPVAVGQQLVIRHGSDVAWYGWIEDIQRGQRGARERVTLQGLGPWQLFQQRLVSATISDVISTYVLRDMMRLHMPELSIDASQLVNTAVPLTRTWVNARAADIVKTVVDAGTSADDPLLFAIWEPAGGRSQVMQAANLLQDPELEHTDTYWVSPGEPYFIWSEGTYNSARYSLRMLEGATGGIYQADRVAVSASTDYVIDYWLKWAAYAGMDCSARFDWYNALNVLISTTYSTTLTSDGATTDWQHIVETVTSPALAVEVVVHVAGAVGSGGGSARNQYVDDIRFYPLLTGLTADTLPRAYLWARDLSGYDYVLHTDNVESGIQVTETTRDLANWVLAKYGSSYTAAAEDTASQALYRQRDAVTDAGDVAEADAEAARDTYLALHASPGTEMRDFTLSDLRSLRTARGGRVSPALVRAGDRVLIGDGRLAGSVVLLEQVTYKDGVVTCRPERYADASRLLARV